MIINIFRVLHDCDEGQAVEGEDDQGEIQKIAHIQGRTNTMVSFPPELYLIIKVILSFSKK